MNKNKTFLFVVLLAMSHAMFSQDKPKIIWEEKIHNFNQISSKDSIAETFFFFNVEGNTPLVIHNVSVSCGCTTVDWIKHPIKPGNKGYVKVMLRLKGQHGYFDKRFFVESNAQKSTDLLRIKGNIK